MLLSYKWLKEYIDPAVSPRQFAEDMTMSGSKVEGYSLQSDSVKGVVVGKVISVDRHPNADKLLICKLDIGKEDPIQVVTGADNVFPGALVPVALDNAELPDGKKIKKGKLRGELSEGMLCSVAELNLSVDDFPNAIEDGILIIDQPCKPGEDINEALGLDDIIFEFEITSNRPDCLSVLGLAREAAATYRKEISIHRPVIKKTTDDINSYLSVKVLDSGKCPRYSAAVVKNIRVKPSPRWLRDRLRAGGVRPINNIVDITNYVMLEYGQPMHAFDLRFIKNNEIIVRDAKPGESITTLDGIERELTGDMLVIADSEKPNALAGIMGGEYSGIMDDTNTIVFESANFLGSSVRTTAKKLGMRTESSSRFEKGLDPNNTLIALERACELVELLDAGDVVGGFIDVYDRSVTGRVIDFDYSWINSFLGTDIPRSEMEQLLEYLGIKADGDKLIIPTFRADIEHSCDIAEEVARLYGYDKIKTKMLEGLADGRLTEYQKAIERIRSILSGQGLNEIITYSFISPKAYDKILLEKDSAYRNSVTIANPLGEDTSVMRTTALPSMLEILSKNYNNSNNEALLYEIGKVYIPSDTDKLPLEKEQLIIGAYSDGFDFFDLKGIVEELLDNLNVKNYDFEQISDVNSFHSGRTASLVIDRSAAGILGEINPVVAGNYEIDRKVYVCIIDLELMINAIDYNKKYQPLPKFPSSLRDIAVVCDIDIPVKQLEAIIKKSAGPLLEKLVLFDVYQGKQIQEGKKSVAFSLIYRRNDRTITDKECDASIKKIIKALEQAGAALRS